MTDVDVSDEQAPFQEAARVRVRRKRKKHRNWIQRQWHERRPLVIIVGFASLLLIALLLWLLFLNKQLDDVRRFPLDLDARPPDGPGTNILLLGTDDPQWNFGDPPVPESESVLAMLEDGTWEPGRYRSDAILVVHISADYQTAQVVSIPRDSYVPIDSEFVGSSGKSKINAAFSWGGAELMTETVEQLTDMRIDHVVVTDFTRFIEVNDALGGIDVFSSEPIQLATGTKPAGVVHLEGEDALAYVRARSTLPRGDFDRVQRHQNYLRAVLTTMTDTRTLVNPVKLTRTVMKLSDMVAVDDSLTTGKMRSLAWRSRELRPGTMRFVTAPYKGTATVPGAGSIVELDQPLVRELFGAVGDDLFEAWYAENFEGDELPGEKQVD